MRSCSELKHHLMRDKEPNKSWAYIVPDLHFWELFHEANIADEESITDILTLPIAYEDNLLDMWRANEDYYFKLTGYLGMVFNSVKEWWEVSNDDARD